MNFAESLDYLASLQKRGWRLGLDRMEEFVRLANLGPSLRLGHVHIAGTNGKGSTTAYAQSILTTQGHRTGGFFSPYVVNIRERIQLDGDWISEDDFARLATRLRPISDSLDATDFGGVTEFEFKTAMGLAYWLEHGCRFVALEVGLGGRLDATNVVNPVACVITSIGWDHMAILGDSLEAIAAEKAGILKPGVPAIIGAIDDGPMAVIEQIAAEKGSPLIRLGHELKVERTGSTWCVTTPFNRYPGLAPGMVGIHQPGNMALAIAACECAGAIEDPERVADGVARAFAPGRFQTRTVNGCRWIFDGAHNVESASALAQTLKEQGIDRVAMIFNMLHGHELEPFVQPLRNLVDSIWVAPIDFYRARTPEECAGELGRLGLVATSCATVAEAISAVSREGVVLVTGSFYLVGDVMRQVLGQDGAFLEAGK